MIIYNRTSGPVRLLGKSLPRHTRLEVDVRSLSETDLQNLRALEAFGSIHCTPSSLPSKEPDPPPKSVAIPEEPPPEVIDLLKEEAPEVDEPIRRETSKSIKPSERVVQLVPRAGRKATRSSR